MQRKSFVSISFTQKKLQVVKLNSGKTRAEKFATVDIPVGIISDYQVVNPQALAVLIKNVWKQLHLREKTVGIVIPEFSSFIKAVEIPKIDVSDLDEAVRWQSQDFLPSSSEEMVMDWRIVGQDLDKYYVLTLAMKKANLAGYVDAVSEAGLFPLLVETPSLSLIRLTPKDSGGKLIVYSNLGETILVVAQGEKILGSSVISQEDKVDIGQTAALIIRHYKEAGVAKIFAGGADLTQASLAELTKTLAKPVELIKVSIKGLPSEQVQKYLVPVSLGFEKSAGPSDESTINLLPQKWVKKYENQRLKLQIWGLLLISTLFILGCLAATGGTYIYLTSQIKVFEKENALKSDVISKELTNQIDQANLVAGKILVISDVSKHPQEVMNAITKAKPPEVTISEYNIDLDTGKSSFKGLALTREPLVKFKEALEANKDFSAVRIPLSSFEAETNLEFEVTFVYLPASKKIAPAPRATPATNVKNPNPGI